MNTGFKGAALNTSKQHGIEDGDWVEVTSSYGTINLKAEFFPGIRPDTVIALQVWRQGCEELGLPSYPLLEGGTNTNPMYNVDEKAFDRLVTVMSSQTLVEVKKVAPIKV